MKLTITRPILDCLADATDKPDWLIERLGELRNGGDGP